MRNIAANALDWYVNKLNKMHLIPVNLATMLRDILSKKLSDGRFSPRPLTADNFTDAELDAIHALADKGDGYGDITGIDYSDVSQSHAMGDFGYGFSVDKMKEVLAPLRAVSTTIGQASVRKDGDDYVLKDTYDFNRTPIRIFKDKDGFMYGEGVRPIGSTKADLSKYLNGDSGGQDKSTYLKLRDAMHRMGHSDNDPDKGKIHARISMGDIRKRLGDSIGTYDIYQGPSRLNLVLKSIGAGALTGAPVGAALGAISGAILLASKKRRKRWLRTMLTHVLGGAAIAAAIGAASSGYASNKIYNMFEKTSESPLSMQKRRNNRKKAIKDALLNVVAYSVPLSLAAIGGIYAKNKVCDLVGKLTGPVDVSKTAKLVFVPSKDDLVVSDNW